MRQPLIHICLGLLVATVSVGCENGADDGGSPEETETSLTPAGKRAKAFMRAVKYRDIEGAFDVHMESTEGGIYCESKSFREILRKTDENKTEKDCEDVSEIGPKHRATLEDDAELLVQVLRFVCEQPEGTCVDYAKRVFESQLPNTAFWRRAEHYDITEVQMDDGSARVYVEYWSSTGDAGGKRRRTLNLEERKGSWYVTNTFGGSSGR